MTRVPKAASARPTSADHFAKALAGEKAEPSRKLLDQIEGRNQRHDQRQETKFPAGAGLGRGHHIAGVGVGEHHQQAGPPGRQMLQYRAASRGGAARFRIHPALSVTRASVDGQDHLARIDSRHGLCADLKAEAFHDLTRRHGV